MPYGLEPQQIVASFAGAISGDFATGGMNGNAVIIQEIEFAYEKIKSYLNEETLRGLAASEYELPSISGDTFRLAWVPVDGSLKVWKVDECFRPCNSRVFWDDCDWECGGYSSDDPYHLWPVQELVAAVDYTGTGRDYVLTNSIGDDYLVAWYELDESANTISSLVPMLRDLVCYNLGNRLFANIEGGEWSIVKHYENEWLRWEKMLSNGKFRLKDIDKTKRLFRRIGIGSLSLLRG